MSFKAEVLRFQEAQLDINESREKTNAILLKHLNYLNEVLRSLDRRVSELQRGSTE